MALGEAVVGEWIAHWICTPQVPGSRPSGYGTFLPSFWLSTTITASSWAFAGVCVEGQGRISWSGLTQDIKMGSCVFQCDVPHQRIAQRQVDGVCCHALCLYTVTGCVVMPCVCIQWRGVLSCPVSVYSDGVGCHALCLYTVTGWGVMPCVCIL